MHVFVQALKIQPCSKMFPAVKAMQSQHNLGLKL